jgi:ABC-type dipeptide/oligopeptide/nickel transport system ATPase component
MTLQSSPVTAGEHTDQRLLDVRNLTITTTGEEPRTLVQGASFHVAPGEFLGVVGESGSGKTLTSLAVARLLPHGLQMTADAITLGGRDLIGDTGDDVRTFLGTGMAMVFQDPMSSLNPARKIGSQMIEAVVEHRGLSKREARELAVRALEDVHVTEPRKRLGQYPHELSGGMRQRVMIAMGLMSEPQLIIADEPTTALDVTVQAQVMKLLVELNAAHRTAVLLITHNIALLSEVCDRIVVMYRGRIVEILTVEELLSGPKHPYTRALVASVPDLSADRGKDLAMVGDEDDRLILEGIDA